MQFCNICSQSYYGQHYCPGIRYSTNEGAPILVSNETIYYKLKEIEAKFDQINFRLDELVNLIKDVSKK